MEILDKNKYENNFKKSIFQFSNSYNKFAYTYTYVKSPYHTRIGLMF